PDIVLRAAFACHIGPKRRSGRSSSGLTHDAAKGTEPDFWGALRLARPRTTSAIQFPISHNLRIVRDLAQLPRFTEQNPLFTRGWDFIPSLCINLVPGLSRLHHLYGNLERCVDLLVHRLRGSGFADLQDLSVGGGENHGDHLVSAELLAQGRPRSVNAAVQESLLDRDQQVISQHTEEDVSLGAILQMMEDRPLSEGTLHPTEGGFHPGQ